ncbi:probable disease resistance protein At4g27220 [Pistacia vera]|uniref:probable disease resistance protein At4g27220 n=1 Tax=Pistacia vera TaxID=55513 RepID=UPI001263441E|nr:probable disease resistance protein At4g27220 [Pistacia vera]
MVEPAGNISSVLGVVLQAGTWVAAPIWHQFKYLYNYNTNFDNLQEELIRLKDAKDRVERKVDPAERNVEEIEGNVKKWQNNVEKTVVQAERLIQDKSNNPRCLKGLCPNLKTRYKHSKKAFKIKRDDIGPLLLQEEKFDRVSYPTVPPEKNFDKLRDDVLKLTNARLKVQRKVEEARNNEEEIEEDVKKWLEDVDSIIVKAEELIKNQSSIGTDRKTRYQNSKAASKLMVEDIGPLLQQEERFHKVSYSTIQQSDYEKNFDKLGDDVLKLTNARRKVQRKVEEARNNEEEIEEDVKKWLEDVDSIIVKAEELIKNQSSIGTDRKTRYQNSKAAFELMVKDIGPLLQQEEGFHKVSYSTIQQSDYENNFDKLGDDVLKLKNARRKVQRKVEEAKNNVEEIEEDVKKWLEDVDSIIVKAEELIENQSSIGTDRETRYKNSKAASELMVDNIGPLLQQEERFEKVSHPTIHKEIWLRYNEDYLAFESRNSTEKNVWEALKDEKIYMMGVYGMGRLGKTTLVQEIGRKAEMDKLFDAIVFVEVTDTPDTKKIQTVIANKLGVKFDDAIEDESQRASKLYSRIEKRNILLIVDNIWEELDLKIVGIPYGADCGRSKILMTIRNVDVLEKMGSAKNVGMGILNEEEAWSLFKKMAGNVIQTPGLNSLPKDVCKECGGLPIVICTIAKALRNRRQKSQWEDALLILRTPSPAKFTRLLEKEYSKIKLRYDYLEYDELKKTFIILSLMENDTSILDFLKNIVGLGILEGANLTIEQARNRLDSVVKELKDSCLLLDGRTEGRFSMHDIVRIVALTCAYTDHHVFTERNDIEKEWKDKDKLRKCTIVSLVGNNIITQLWPEALDCPKLEFLRGSSFEISMKFFTMMPKLKVLNLFRIQQLLPSSLDLLANLQTLCLDDSKIEDVAIVGKLKKLKSLVIFTNLQALELKKISFGKIWDNQFPTLMSSSYQNLTSFILWGCRKIKYVFPSSIAKSLQTLQHLEIMHCEVLEEIVEEEEEAKDVNFAFPQVTFLELQNLPKLAAFYPGIHTCELPMLKRLEIKKCEKFTSKYLSFQENSLHIPEPKPLCLEHKINSNLEDLSLKNKLTRITWESQFKTLEIIYDKSANIPLGLLYRFENLENLQLYSCGYKEMFSCGKDEKQMQITLGPSLAFFQNVKVLNVRECRELMKLMTPSTARSLV